MKKTALIIAAMAVAGVSYADNVTTKPSYSVTSDFSYTSEYVFRGLKNSNAAFQGSIEVGQDDARLGVWTNQPINSKNYINEIDLYAGYKVKLDRDFKVDFVGTYYYYPEADSNAGVTHHSYEIGVGGIYSLGGLNPGFAGIDASLYYYYDFRLHQQTLQASLGYSFPLKDFGTSLDFNVFGGTVSASNLAPDSKSDVDVQESWNYYGVGVNIPYKLAENAQAHIGASVSQNDKYFTNSGGLPHRDFSLSAGITIGF
jgi:uncharacterized protein (TIGR02001 family)